MAPSAALGAAGGSRFPEYPDFYGSFERGVTFHGGLVVGVSE